MQLLLTRKQDIQCSRSGWMLLWATWSWVKDVHAHDGVGLDDLQRSLLTQTIIRFYWSYSWFFCM